MPFEMTYAVSLPLLLLYLLLILRVIERRQVSPEIRPRLLSLINVRDAALMTLALDVAEIVQGLTPFIIAKERPLFLAIAVALLITHISVFFLANTRQRAKELEQEEIKRSNFTRTVIDAYLALALLMTNATTIIIVMQAAGRGM